MRLRQDRRPGARPVTAWFRAFAGRYLIADDPYPRYSRLDILDGLKGTP